MPLSWNEIRDRSIAFAREWQDETSEHAEAKSFWDGFFNVFGVSRRRVATFEAHVKKASGAQGFIDLFWPGMLLAEHKSRGKNLDSAYEQAIDYFPGLADKELPRYIVVSDFARFRVRNLDTGESIEFPLSELPNHLPVFGFIAGYETRRYKEQDPVNVRAAEKLGKLHDALRDIGYTGHRLEVYLVRLLFCLFADDTGIFMPRSAFEDFIRSRTSEDGSDLAPWLNAIFQALNTLPEDRYSNTDEQIAAFPYVNGKLFEEQLPQASFDRKMRDTLLECCDLDWGGISPAIFGSLFQGIMDAEVRRNLGAHYTSEQNILKVIGPLFLDELRAEFTRIKTQRKKLEAFHEKLGQLQFFDPACGCGNFLVISYREIRLLELEVIKILHERDQQQLSMDAVDQYVKVDVDQFHGIEIEEWPAQIARVAMWLIDHQMNLLVGETFGQALVRIPLVKSANIVHGNALRIDWESVVHPRDCDYVFGNPPFLGKHNQSRSQRSDQSYVMGDIKSHSDLDFVANWYVKAATFSDGFNSEFAFVSTSSITQGEQVPLLWPFLFGRFQLRIRFAHRTFSWANEAANVAAVHCVVIGLTRSSNFRPRLYDYATPTSDPVEVKVEQINPYLVDGPDIVIRKARVPISERPTMRCGNKPSDGGNLIMSADEANMIKSQYPSAESMIRPYMGTEEFLNGSRRYCLWLSEDHLDAALTIPPILDRLRAVRAFRESSTAPPTRKSAETPYRFFYVSQPGASFIAMPEVSSERRKYVPVGFMPSSIIVSNKIYVVPTSDLFVFGLLQSLMHMAWLATVGGRLESRFQYSGTMVYNTFPFPVDVTEAQRDAVEGAAQRVVDVRAVYASRTLASLYDPLVMPRDLLSAHAALDRAVDAAYVLSGGKRVWGSEAERVAFLFELYQRITSMLPPEKPAKARRRSKG